MKASHPARGTLSSPSAVALLTLFTLLAGCGTAAPTASSPPTSAADPAGANPAASASAASAEVQIASDSAVPRVERTPEEWRAQLEPERYRILREKGTERARTGEYWDTKTAGTYRCAGCGLALFDSTTKFKSGTGWPSFWKPVEDRHVLEEIDRSYGVRTEILCAGCDGHLGHVFPDGPEPTGLRYCVNSASLRLEPLEE